ncbi:MAG: mobile mystery protein B [Candidatus Margulisiibacteriota bacterium]
MEFFETIPGATPIEDISGLLPTHTTNRKELNEWEAENVLKATREYLTQKKEIKISINFLKKVHYEMFDQTWEWAGKFRQSNFNVGVDKHKILEELKKLIDDFLYWETEDAKVNILNRSIRLHHRLVLIHPFVNGNGRHARLISDIYLFSKGHKIPNWPSKELIEHTNIRKKYIDALKAADHGEYEPLENFTRKLL